MEAASHEGRAPHGECDDDATTAEAPTETGAGACFKKSDVSKNRTNLENRTNLRKDRLNVPLSFVGTKLR